MLSYEGITITATGHSGFRVTGDKTIYIDPFKLTGSPPPADVVCVTHEHHDHASPEDLRKVVTAATSVVTTAACQAALAGLGPRQVHVVKPGDALEVEGISVRALPAYNVNKFRSPGVPFHPQPDGKVGFLLRLQPVTLYHAGDTDEIPEMEQAKGADIAFLPVSGKYVMTPEEAAEACKRLAPKLAIPMHWGAIVGSVEDAKRFKTLAPCRVEILEAE